MSWWPPWPTHPTAGIVHRYECDFTINCTANLRQHLLNVLKLVEEAVLTVRRQFQRKGHPGVHVQKLGERAHASTFGPLRRHARQGNLRSVVGPNLCPVCWGTSSTAAPAEPAASPSDCGLGRKKMERDIYKLFFPSVSSSFLFGITADADVAPALDRGGGVADEVRRLHYAEDFVHPHRRGHVLRGKLAGHVPRRYFDRELHA
jgi:hypothetical protein